MDQARELAMFGCPIADFKASVEDSITFQVSGIGMVVMSMLSDVQEMLVHGATREELRQALNRVKYLVTEYNLGGNGERIMP